MRVLVIGGSVFLGRAVVGEALARGDEVTVFNRGRSGAQPGGVTQLVGDRTVAADLEQLRGREFDLVVDTCGYVPADVARSTGVLAAGAGHYAFVSTINVYPGWPEHAAYWAGGTHDGDPTATEAPDGVEAYGWLKVGCERAVERAFGARSTILRAGCIVGPDDSAVGRLPWWIDRVARGGETLVPGTPQDELTLIDARDLARFALAAAPGTFTVTGAASTRGALMSACRDATGSAASFTYVADDWLAAQPVEPWTEIPLWAGPGTPGLFAEHQADAVAAGLSCRPLASTVADTWAWQRSTGWTPAPRTPGLTVERERELLATWRSQRQP